MVLDGSGRTSCQKEGIFVEQDTKEAIALFKFGLIAPMLNGQVVENDYLAKLAGEKHSVPGLGIREYTPKTFKRWMLDYRKEGFEGLKPKSRKDRGLPRSLTREEEEHLIALRGEQRGSPVTVFYDYLVAQGEILPADVSYSTIFRLLKRNGLTGRSVTPAAERKRFAYNTVNMLWQGDYSYGPYLTVDGRKKQAYLFAFIDDCSRLVPSAAFSLAENMEPLKQVFCDAVLRRGLPKIVYVDNGKIYRSEVFQIACATLGVNLSHTQPYDAPAKGKVERFFKTVKTRFFPLLGIEPAKTLEELNQRFWKWLEEDYHRKAHSSLDGKTPLDVWLAQASTVRMLLGSPNPYQSLFKAG
jgi:putative transposase